MTQISHAILTARKPVRGGKPVSDREEQILLLERREEIQKGVDGNIQSAKLNFFMTTLNGHDGSELWGASYERVGTNGRPRARLSNGLIVLPLDELKGRRIGTYLLKEIVDWAMQWPEADLYPVSLNADHATPDNMPRRNRLYIQFGIDMPEDTIAGSSSYNQKMSDLNTVEKPENITVERITTKLRDLINRNEHLKFQLSECNTIRRNESDALQVQRRELRRIYVGISIAAAIAGLALRIWAF